MAIKAGDRMPAGTFKTMGKDGPRDLPTDELFKGKTVVLFSVPGAFTPTCDAKHLPGFVQHAADFKAKGVDTVACMAVNDVFVMKAWGKASAVDDKVLMLADTIRANFDMAIMDLPRHFVMREPALFNRFDDIVIVTELTLQSLRDTNRLQKLLSVRNRQAKIHVIANNVTSRPDVSAKEFEDAMEAKLRCVFAHDPKVMTRSAMKGQPIATTDPKSRLVTDLHRLCIELAGVPEEVKTGFFRRRAGRK